MANQFQYVDWMAMECLDLLTNEIGIVSEMNTEFEEDFSKPFAVGASLRVKKPQRYTIRDGLGYSPQALDRITTTVNCDQVFGIDFEWDDFEKALLMERSEEQISKEYLAPAMAQIAQEWDSRAAQFIYQNSNNFVGTLGTDPSSFDTVSAAARQRLVELGGAKNGKDRAIFVPPNVMRALKNSAISYFNPVSDISKQFRTGVVGAGDGFDWYESMSLWSHTAGTSTSPTMSGNSANGDTTLAVTCTTGDTFNAGDAYVIASVNQVNPMTRRKTTTVQKPFVVTVATTGVSSAATLSISPAIYGPGSQYQNVDALPLSGAALTLFIGTSSPNAKTGINGLAFSKDAFAFASVRLGVPKMAEVKWEKRDPKTGVTVRFVRAWDPVQSKYINRFDCLGGFGRLYSDECCVRLLGA